MNFDVYFNNNNFHTNLSHTSLLFKEMFLIFNITFVLILKKMLWLLFGNKILTIKKFTIAFVFILVFNWIIYRIIHLIIYNNSRSEKLSRYIFMIAKL